jgi:predicted acetyltransferase
VAVSQPEIRTIAPEELEAWVKAVESAFSFPLKQEFLELERSIARPDRYLAAIDDGRIVGGNASIPLDLTVPGGASVVTCGINGVGVQPSHTRRGISTALMRRQLDDTHERGEALSVLHASEAAIYGRYGFGVGTRDVKLGIDTRRGAFVRGYEPSGRCRVVDRPEAEAAFVSVLGMVADRPGWAGPPDRFVPWQVGDIVVESKDDPPLYVVHEDEEGTIDAAAVYRAKHEWPDGIPTVKVEVEMLVSATPEGNATIWRFLLDLDLVATLEVWKRPIDEALFRLVREPRALRMLVRDGMHLRLVDLPTALEARGYRGSGRLVLGVEDIFCPWNDGTWELEVDDGRATCRRSDAEPDLWLPVTDLASAYLGDASFTELADALRVRSDGPEALVLADALFASRPAPWCWLMI